MGGPRLDRLPRTELVRLQGERLRLLLAEILPRNAFYAEKFKQAGLTLADVHSRDDLRRLPFTTKAELLAEQAAHPPYGRLLTYALDDYCRLHQTSGTSGQPLRWLDTRRSWQAMLDCWDQIFDVVELSPRDRLFFPFSFGPFIGFWTAFETAARRGNWCLPGGGMSTVARLRFLLDHQATVVLCTPTYALHLVEVAEKENLDLPASAVRMVIVAGEPGGSIAAVRERIERGFGARVFDHSGMTETGPIGIECPENPAGVHLLEHECIAEILDPQTLQSLEPGQQGELVVTHLGRQGCPLLRYRTGDLVRAAAQPCRCGRTFLRLEGGILGRVDDMIHVRGNNLHPSTLEAVLRRFPDLAEYQVEVDHTSSLAVLRIEVEPLPSVAGTDLAARIDEALRDALLFRAEVRPVAPGALPRYEMKAKRVRHVR